MNGKVTVRSLTRSSMGAAIEKLAAADLDLARIVELWGAPPLRQRRGGFATLVMLIVEQQVSLASGAATFARLTGRCGEMSPERILALSDDDLRAAGLSRQKARYVRLLSEAIAGGAFDPAALARMSDDEARAALTSLTGIGAWTSEIYLLTVMRRPDAWPAGDRALVVAAREIKRLEADPTTEQMDALAEAWRPYRSVAARLLWLHYRESPRLRPAK